MRDDADTMALVPPVVDPEIKVLITKDYVPAAARADDRPLVWLEIYCDDRFALTREGARLLAYRLNRAIERIDQ